jgi:hypothetical protein
MNSRATVPFSIVAILLTGSLATRVAAAPLLETFVESSTYGLSDIETGPPPSAITSSFNHRAGSNHLSAAASADDGGHSAAKVDGLFASPSFGINFATARATLTYSTVNTSGAAADFFFSFLILGPRLEIQDFAGLRTTSPGAPHARYVAEIVVNGDTLWSSSAELFGGRITHALSEFGTDLGGVRYGAGGLIGYQFSNFSDTLALGTFAAGETITVEAILQADLESAGFELGATAEIGDPNELTTTGGFGGGFASVPEPSTVALFAAGLALTGWRRRR